MATSKVMSDQVGAGQQILYYMEVPAQLFGRIAQGIATAGRAKDARVMVEKPFGTDLASSRQLNDTMHQYFPEDASFRVCSPRRPTCRCAPSPPSTTPAPRAPPRRTASSASWTPRYHGLARPQPRRHRFPTCAPPR